MPSTSVEVGHSSSCSLPLSRDSSSHLDVRASKGTPTPNEVSKCDCLVERKRQEKKYQSFESKPYSPHDHGQHSIKSPAAADRKNTATIYRFSALTQYFSRPDFSWPSWSGRQHEQHTPAPCSVFSYRHAARECRKVIGGPHLTEAE